MGALTRATNLHGRAGTACGCALFHNALFLIKDARNSAELKRKAHFVRTASAGLFRGGLKPPTPHVFNCV